MQFKYHDRLRNKFKSGGTNNLQAKQAEKIFLTVVRRIVTLTFRPTIPEERLNPLTLSLLNTALKVGAYK